MNLVSDVDGLSEAGPVSDVDGLSEADQVSDVDGLCEIITFVICGPCTHEIKFEQLLYYCTVKTVHTLGT